MEQNKMKFNHQIERKKIKPRVPIFASPWVALFLVLRDELTLPRVSSK
jgi:hypothetical protein